LESFVGSELVKQRTLIEVLLAHVGHLVFVNDREVDIVAGRKCSCWNITRAWKRGTTFQHSSTIRSLERAR
ncbi:MAG TPA: hypothetical protein VIT23_15810, partial [Terrimicrobiaceae bacterium]